jgi:hypothetical protein
VLQCAPSPVEQRDRVRYFSQASPTAGAGQTYLLAVNPHFGPPDASDLRVVEDIHGSSSGYLVMGVVAAADAGAKL